MTMAIFHQQVGQIKALRSHTDESGRRHLPGIRNRAPSCLRHPAPTTQRHNRFGAAGKSRGLGTKLNPSRTRYGGNIIRVTATEVRAVRIGNRTAADRYRKGRLKRADDAMVLE